MNLIFFVAVPLDIKYVDSFSPPMRRGQKTEINSLGIAACAWLVLVVFHN